MENSVLMEQLSRYYTVWRETNFVYEEWSKAHGMSFNSVMVLYSLYEEKGNCTQKAISQKWVIPKQTVHMILKDFEKRGLIALIPMESDKRNKLVNPTPKGEQYINEIITQLHRLELFVIEKMGAERMKRMSDDLALFTELFQKGEHSEHE